MTLCRDSTSSVLERKLQAYNEFLSVTMRLKKALESGDQEAVIHLIGSRDELINIINQLDQTMLSTSDEELRSESILELLRQIVQMNQECEALAIAGCGNMRKDLAGLQLTEKGIRGYAGSDRRIPIFLNISS